MANDYINPFSAVDPAAFGEGKTPLEAFFGYQKNLQAQPFIDMARQQGQMDLQTNQQKQTEFMSPEAQKARMSGFGAESAKNKQIMDVSPHETLYKIKKAQDDLRASPFITDELIAKSQKYVQDFKHEPFNEFKAGLGGLGERLDQLPANMPKGMKDALGKSLYGKFVTDWQMKYPNEKLPEHLKYYDQDTPHQIKIAQYTNLEVQKRAAQERLKQMEVEGHIKQSQIFAGGTVQAARETAAQSGRNAELAYGGKQDQSANSRAQHIQGAVDKALGSTAYILAKTPEEKAKLLSDAEETASRIYNTYGMGRQQSANSEYENAPRYALGSPLPAGMVEVTKDGKKARIKKGDLSYWKSQGYTEVR